MAIQVNGKQIDIGQALKTYVENKIDEIITKYSTKNIDSNITFSKDRHEFLCDITSHLATGITTQSKGKSDNIYESFDAAINKVEKQLRRYKRRLKNHHNVRKEPIEFSNAPSYVISGNVSDLESEKKESLQPVIIAELETRIPKLSVGEAVMQMELIGSNMLIFRNSSNNSINVVHFREDGNIGWVDPDYTK
jgi:ribosomal subunit interface protein